MILITYLHKTQYVSLSVPRHVIPYVESLYYLVIFGDPIVFFRLHLKLFLSQFGLLGHVPDNQRFQNLVSLASA